MSSAAAQATATSPLLDLSALAAVEHLRFATRQRIEGAYSGRHRSRQQGGAGEFVDYRQYTDGEDLRRLDWKVLARSGRAFIRLFQDETNLLCTLALDVSGSMQFGARSAGDATGSKLHYSQRLAASLGYIIGRGQDQVGLAVLGQGLQDFVATGSTQTHLARIYDKLGAVRPQPTRTMAAGLRELFERVSRRGVLLLFSDFLMEDLDEFFAALRLFRHRQWEVLALHLVHPLEERLPEGTAFRFEGLEGEGTVDCSPAEIRADYERRFGDYLSMVRNQALSAGCDYRRISTAVDYLQTLRAFLVERNG